MCRGRLQIRPLEFTLSQISMNNEINAACSISSELLYLSLAARKLCQELFCAFRTSPTTVELPANASARHREITGRRNHAPKAPFQWSGVTAAGYQKSSSSRSPPKAGSSTYHLYLTTFPLQRTPGTLLDTYYQLLRRCHTTYFLRSRRITIVLQLHSSLCKHKLR